ncbi:MAG TPA: hypothetical protein VGC91_19435 [Pyrinomonadaceae bacterium]|jgi:hypothetical protein
MMKNKILLGSLTLALFVTGACSSTTNSNNANSNSANKNGNANTNASAPANSNNTGAAPANSSSSSNTAANDTAAQDFTLHNKTGVVIDKLFVSPSDKEEWGEDILGQDTLGDGQSVEIKFHPKEKAPKWDLKVQDSSGNSIEWHDLNLTEISEVTLHYDNGKGTAEVK